MLDKQLLEPDVLSWLSEALPESCPPWTWERISGGYSMLTYRLFDHEGRSWVLRLPPSGEKSGRAHDTDREARVMTALGDTAVPVPRVRVVGSQADPLGVPCHITDFVTGYVLNDLDAAVGHLSPKAIHAASVDIVCVLAQLHAVDPDEVGLRDFGPRSNYVERQLRRWKSVVAESCTPEVEVLGADLASLAEHLEAHIPKSGVARVVHGDFRLGNAIVGDDGTVRAVLDWEMSTLGDPMADLGLLAAFWDPPSRAMLGVRMPTAASDAIDVDAALRLYADMTGSDLDGFWFYRVFSAWRLACTAFRARKRYASGAMGDDSGASRFVETCTDWAQMAHEALAAQ